MTQVGSPPREGAAWDLAAESITVKIRWFGVVVGYVLVNLLTDVLYSVANPRIRQ